MNAIAARYDYPFSSDEMQKAYDVWGANCGPTALAFALQSPLERARDLLPDFERRGYTSPTMMLLALERAGEFILDLSTRARSHPDCAFSNRIALTRVQWTGPWTKEGANPKWAYCQTHWIATWRDESARRVFDVNSGIVTFADWSEVVAPSIIKAYKRADGGWYFTHIWQLGA